MTDDLAHQLARRLASMPTDEQQRSTAALVAILDQATARIAADTALVHLITQLIDHTQGDSHE